LDAYHLALDKEKVLDPAGFCAVLASHSQAMSMKIPGLNNAKVNEQKGCEEEVDIAIDGITAAVEHLRKLSPLYDLHKEGIDITTIEWQSH
jgi:hypothetical protein